MSPPLVSVITPVFNTRPYLQQCLDSLAAQTLKPIEMICVDNGSTDGSYEFLVDYARAHSNMLVVKHAEGRQGGARNAGIEIARGQYIGFVDSDDFVSPDMFQKMYEAAETDTAQVVVCNIQYYHNGSGYGGTSLPMSALDTNGSAPIQNRPRLLRNTTIANKLFARDLILDYHVRFPVGIFHEDVFFIIMAFVLAKRIATVPESLYFYRRQRPGSVNEQRGADSLSIFNVMQMVDDFIADKQMAPFLNLLLNEVKAVKYLYLYPLTGKSFRKAYFEKMQTEFKATELPVQPYMLSPTERREFQFVREHGYAEYNLFLSLRTVYGWFLSWTANLKR